MSISTRHVASSNDDSISTSSSIIASLLHSLHYNNKFLARIHIMAFRQTTQGADKHNDDE